LSRIETSDSMPWEPNPLPLPGARQEHPVPTGQGYSAHLCIIIYDALEQKSPPEHKQEGFTTGWFGLEFHHQAMVLISFHSTSLNWRLTICTEPCTVLECSHLPCSIFANRAILASWTQKLDCFSWVPLLGLAFSELQKTRTGTALPTLVKRNMWAEHKWLTPIILATWEAELRWIVVQSQPRHSLKTLSQTIAGCSGVHLSSYNGRKCKIGRTQSRPAWENDQSKKYWRPSTFCLPSKCKTLSPPTPPKKERVLGMLLLLNLKLIRMEGKPSR
jgi:hypothetical protein